MKTATKRKPKTHDEARQSSPFHLANAKQLDTIAKMTRGDDESDGAGPALMTLEDDGDESSPVAPRQESRTSADSKRENAALPNAKSAPRSAGLSRSDRATEPATRELIPIRLLGPSPWQPRKEFNDDELQQLAESIQANGGNWTDCLVWRVSGQYVIDQAIGKRGAKSDKSLPEYFVLAGERRLRACQRGEAQLFPACSSLWCRVFEGTAEEAERLCRLENLHRKDLTALEQARNLKAMVESGKWATQAAIAKEVGITPAALSNQLRVLDLPQVWLDLVSQEKLTVTHLRCLVPWKDRPTVLAEVRHELNENYDWGLKEADGQRMPTVAEWEEAVAEAVIEVSRPVIIDRKKHFYESHRIRLKHGFDWIRIDEKNIPSPKEIEAARSTLDIVDVPDVGERAFNCEAWDKLSRQVTTARAKSASSGDGASSSKGQSGKAAVTKKLTAAEQRAKSKAQAEQFAKRLYRYRLAWLQKAIVARIADASAATLLAHVLAFASVEGHGGLSRRHEEFGEAVITCGGTQKSKKTGYMRSTDVWASLATLANSGEGLDLAGLVRTALTSWYQHDFETSSTDTPPEFLEGAAAHLGIDIEQEWHVDCEFLELHNHEQLVELAKEWKVPQVAEYEKLKRAAVLDAMAAWLGARNEIDPSRPYEHLGKWPLPKCLAKVKPCNIAR